MSRLINADELKSKFLEMGCIDGKPCYGAEIIDRMSTVQAIPIPDNATNGDMIKAMFPEWKIEHIRKMSGMNRYECNIDTINRISFYDDWWNEPYKGSDKE